MSAGGAIGTAPEPAVAPAGSSGGSAPDAAVRAAARALHCSGECELRNVAFQEFSKHVTLQKGAEQRSQRKDAGRMQPAMHSGIGK